MNCPYCKSIIDKNKIEKNTVHCPNCHEVFNIVKCFEAEAKTNFDIKKPPKGTWFSTKKTKKIIGATFYSYKGYSLLLLFLLGLLIFSEKLIYGASEAIIYNILGIIIFVLPMLYLALTLLIGKIEITIENNRLNIFQGIGNVGFSKKIEIKDINEIRLEEEIGRGNSKYKAIFIKTDKENKLGTSLNEKQIYFMYFALKQQIGK